MSSPYVAIAIQSSIPAIRKVDDYPVFIAHLSGLVDAAISNTGLEYPVRLVVLPEASFQGFRDELHDTDHAEYAATLAVDIPGRETQALARIARKHRAHLVASAKARHPQFPGRYFNVAFIVSPEGEVIHQHFKLQSWVKERSLTPHDVYTRWVELHGDGLDAFFPVARLPIGNIGTTICMEGSFPEIYRGLALNGAEIVTRPSYPEPWVAQGMWEVQNRARALDNTCYVVSPNQGWAIRTREGAMMGGGNGGRSMIVDYRGRIMSELAHADEGFAAAVIDIEGLRHHRMQTKFCNFLPYLRSEVYRQLYAAPVWPKDEMLEHPPGPRAHAEATFDATVENLRARGAFTVPKADE